MGVERQKERLSSGKNIMKKSPRFDDAKEQDTDLLHSDAQKNLSTIKTEIQTTSTLDILQQSLAPAQGGSTTTTTTKISAAKTLQPENADRPFPGKKQADIRHTLSPENRDDALRQSFFYEAFSHAGLPSTDFAACIDILKDDWDALSAYRGGSIRIDRITQIIKYVRMKRSREKNFDTMPTAIEEWKQALLETCIEKMDREMNFDTSHNLVQWLKEHGTQFAFLLQNQEFYTTEQKKTLTEMIKKIMDALQSGMYIEIYEFHLGDDGNLHIVLGNTTIIFPIGNLYSHTR